MESATAFLLGAGGAPLLLPLLRQTQERTRVSGLQLMAFALTPATSRQKLQQQLQVLQARAAAAMQGVMPRVAGSLSQVEDEEIRMGRALWKCVEEPLSTFPVTQARPRGTLRFLVQLCSVFVLAFPSIGCHFVGSEDPSSPGMQETCRALLAVVTCRVQLPKEAGYPSAALPALPSRSDPAPKLLVNTGALTTLLRLLRLSEDAACVSSTLAEVTRVLDTDGELQGMGAALCLSFLTQRPLLVVRPALAK